MPLALVIIGLLMVITGVKNTHAQFGAELKSEFTGPGNFTYWFASIVIIGAIGYSKPFKPFANAFLALVLIVIVLKNGGVFDKLKEALAQGPTATAGTAIAEAGPLPVKVEQQAANGASGGFQKTVELGMKYGPYLV